MVQKALQKDVAALLAVTNIPGPGQGFSSDLAHEILQSSAVQERLLQNIVDEMDAHHYYGLNLDFEYVYQSDRQAYNRFIEKAAEHLHRLDYMVTTALAPKLRADQPGLLYEAHDYPAHGAAVDRVILMTYEWGYTYGPAQAVAPIDQVEKVLRYATSVIPAEKILMGMPNYGYDWTLPFQKGTAARSLSNLGAVQLAAQVGAQIHYDERVQAPWFTYYDSRQREHIVWFDDARSIAARLGLVEKYGLAGVSYWNINTYFPQNWLVQNDMYDIIKKDDLTY